MLNDTFPFSFFNLSIMVLAEFFLRLWTFSFYCWFSLFLIPSLCVLHLFLPSCALISCWSPTAAPIPPMLDGVQDPCSPLERESLAGAGFFIAERIQLTKLVPIHVHEPFIQEQVVFCRWKHSCAWAEGSSASLLGMIQHHGPILAPSISRTCDLLECDMDGMHARCLARTPWEVFSRWFISNCRSLRRNCFSLSRWSFGNSIFHWIENSLGWAWSSSSSSYLQLYASLCLWCVYWSQDLEGCQLHHLIS